VLGLTIFFKSGSLYCFHQWWDGEHSNVGDWPLWLRLQKKPVLSFMNLMHWQL